MFGLKIVSSKKWDEMEKLLRCQERLINHANEALGKAVDDVESALKKAVKNAQNHS